MIGIETLHGVDTKTEVTFNFNLLLLHLSKKGWNVKIFDTSYNLYKHTITTRNGSWLILATNDPMISLGNGDIETIRENVENSKFIALDVLKESMYNMASLTWQNHGEKEKDRYLQLTPVEAQLALDKCKAHYFISKINEAEGMEEFAKEFRDCMADIIGYAKCGNDYDSYEVVESDAKYRDLALEKYAKLLKLRKKEVTDISCEKMLENITEAIPARVVTYDMECIENSGDYTAILKEHLSQAKLKTKVTHISDELDYIASIATIKFKVNKTEHVWEISQNSDWVSNDFYQRLNRFIESFGKGTLLSIDTGDQTLKTVFLETDIASYMCEEGVCAIPY
jgi:hypothetical protein